MNIQKMYFNANGLFSWFNSKISLLQVSIENILAPPIEIVTTGVYYLQANVIRTGTKTQTNYLAQPCLSRT